MKQVAILFLLLLARTAIAAGEGPKPDYKAECEALSRDYQRALNAFFEPFQKAKTEEERAGVRIDWTQHPAYAFAPKALALAARARGTEAGLDALLWYLQNVGQGGMADRTLLPKVVDRIAIDYADSPKLEPFATTLAFMSWSLGREKCETILRDLSEKSPHKKVQAAALYSLASQIAQERGKRAATAKELFGRLIREYGDTTYAARATGYINELEHLQVGMVAPDFEAMDQDGKKFKLSDYRGKVVVLDFWGFW